MTQIAMSALRSVENAKVVVGPVRAYVAFASRITTTGHVVGGCILGFGVVAAEYAYAHPMIGLVASSLLLTGTVRRGLHRLAGVCLTPAD